MRSIIIPQQLLVAALLLHLVSSAVAGEQSEVQAIPLVLPSLANMESLRTTRQELAFAWAYPASLARKSASARQPENKLGNSISSAAKVSLIELGVATAKEALQDCLKGEYPGGGMGVLSLPYGRGSARTDHCRW